MSSSTYRDVVVAPVPLTALCTPPVLVPDVVAELHAGRDLLLALGHRGAALAHVVLLLRPLGPVGRGGPGDGGEAAVLLVLAGLNGLGALLSVPVLVVAHVALQAGHGAEEGLETDQQGEGEKLHGELCLELCFDNFKVELSNNHHQLPWPALQ